MRKLTAGLYDHSWSPLFVAGVICILLSVWQLITQDAINPDGICYLQSAAAVLRQHTAALHFCDQSGWPFYQVLIAGVSLMTHLPVTQAANLLNTALSLGTVLTFVTIVFNLTPDKRIRWLAVATILMSHHFNTLRADVIRDHGYWFFYLLSVYWLLRCVMAPVFRERFVCALLWGLSVFVATLFRLEGAVSLVLLPALVFFLPRRHFLQKMGSYLYLNSVLLLLLPLILVWMVMHPGQSLGRFDYLMTEVTQGGRQLVEHWHVASDALGKSVLNVYSARDAGSILGLAMLGYYVLGLIDVLTPGVFILVFYAFWRRLPVIPREKKRVLAACVLVNVVITAFFLAQNFFLARRYLMALSLILSLWVPFALDDLIRRWPVRRLFLLLAVLLLILSAIGGIFRFGPSNYFVRASGEWLAAHAAVHDRLFSNDRTVLWYAGRPDSELFGSGHSQPHGQRGWYDYDWLALRMKQHDCKVIPGAVSVHTFHNAHGSEVRIYRIKKQGTS